MTTQITSHQQLTWGFLFGGWVIALVATLGAAFVGEVMGQAPCELCWYQRVFMFPLVLVLGIGCLIFDLRAYRYALPLAAIGWAVAFFHTLIFFGIIPEAIHQCSGGPSCVSSEMKLGYMPLPLLSLAAFSGIIALLIAVRARGVK